MSKCNGNGKRTQRRRRTTAVRVPRPVPGTVARIRRVLNAGNVVRGAADAGSQWGTVPSSLLDWASLQALFAQFRLLSVTNHYILSGEYDGTPAYPTFWVYHDFSSQGAPSSLQDAFVRQGVKALSFSATNTKRSFTYVPKVWTSSGFATQLPAPQVWGQTATALPVFSSVSGFTQNYNTTVGSPTIVLLQEMLLEFRQPL